MGEPLADKSEKMLEENEPSDADLEEIQFELTEKKGVKFDTSSIWLDLEFAGVNLDLEDRNSLVQELHRQGLSDQSLALVVQLYDALTIPIVEDGYGTDDDARDNFEREILNSHGQAAKEAMERNILRVNILATTLYNLQLLSTDEALGEETCSMLEALCQMADPSLHAMDEVRKVDGEWQAVPNPDRYKVQPREYKVKVAEQIMAIVVTSLQLLSRQPLDDMNMTFITDRYRQ